MQETHVYVVTHKEFDDKCYKEYIPIAVGKNLLENNQCHYQKPESVKFSLFISRNFVPKEEF